MILEPNQVALDDYLMGSRQPVSCKVITPSTEGTDQDARFMNRTYMGRDYVSGHVLGLEMVARGRTPADARAALRGLAAVWANAEKRTKPGSECVLRYAIAGETVRVYGRPRPQSFKSDPNRLTYMGRATASGEFVTTDPLFYSDTERTTGRITLLPAPSGGVQLPATLPFTLSKAVPRTGLVDVGGDADTPVRIIVHGPLTGKWSVTVGGRKVEMNHTLAYDRSVLIDTRTMSVVEDTGANLAGKLSRRVLLPDVRLPLGPSEVIFEGNDDSGTSWAEVLFHDAYYGF